MKQRTAKHSGGWFLPYLRQQGLRFMAAALAGTLAAACAGALMFTSGYLISRSALQPENVLMVYVPVVLVRAFGLGKAVIQYLERLISHDTVLRILSRMRVRLYRVLEPQALHIRSRFRTGDLLGLLAEDIEQLQNVYLRLLLPVVTALVIYGTGIAALGFMDGTMALLMALYCGFFMFTIPVFALFASRRRRQRFIAVRSQAYQELTDAVFGMSDWVLSGRTAQFQNEFDRTAKSMAELEKRMRRAEWRERWLLQCPIAGAVLMMALWAGGMSAGGGMGAEWVAAYALVMFPLLDVLVRTGEAIIRTPDYRESLHRLTQVEKTQATSAAEREATGKAADAATGETGKRWNAVKEQPDIGRIMAKEKLNAATMTAPGEPDAARKASREASALEHRHGGVDLELNGVSFRYPGESEWVLHDVTLRVPKGGKVAVIGRSGAGKTTLLNVIQGELAPVSGTVTVNGAPVREAAGKQAAAGAKSLFAVLNQQPYLFDTTVMNNIRLGRPDASDEEVRAAAELAGLGELIASLPDGLNTRVREAGVRFSGGERQRIALARVLLQNRPVVLLDEPTVGLDPVTERALLDTIFAALEGKTLIWITHHLTGMERVDRIVFMDRGRIVMQGTHEELMRNHERYRRLYALDRP